MSAARPGVDTLADADDLVQAMRAAYRQASVQEVRELRHNHLNLCGHAVSLSTVGRRLGERINRPFAHVQVHVAGTTSPDLTVELWDESETGVGCPGCHITDELDAGAGDVVTVSPDNRYVSLQRARSRTIYDRKQKHILGWSCDGDRVSLIELGRPMQYLLCYWFADAGLQLMHSGMVGEDGVGILVSGRSGSGKSTTSLLCLDAGMDYLGDDFIAMKRMDDDRFFGYSIYNSNHLKPRDVDRFERIKPHATTGACLKETKWVVMLHDSFPAQVLPSLPIGAVVIPRVVDQPRSSYQTAKKSEALMAIAPSSIVLIDGMMRQGLARLGDLVENVPAYWLNLGRDFRSTTDCVRSIIKEVKTS